MDNRKRINLIAMLLVGLGMPVYYKVRYFLAGELTLDQIFSVYLIADIFFPLSLAATMVYGYQFMEKRFLKSSTMWMLTSKVMILIVLATGVSISYSWFFFTYIVPYPLGSEFYFDFVLMSLLVPLFVNGVGMTLHYYQQWKSESSQRQNLEEENLKAQFEILKNQVNPHFLFNCFNALSVLIKESQSRADEFLKHLAKVYRFVLEVKEKELIKVREELEVMQSYVHLMKGRLGDKLSVSLNIPDAQQELYIPPLTLQILMENALKHNKATKDEPLRIDIQMNERNEISFKNNLNLVQDVQSTNIGLKNIIERYEYLSDSGIQIEKDADSFAVNVPLISMEK